MKYTLSDRTRQLEPSATGEVSNLVQSKKREGIDIIQLAEGEPDFDTPKNIKEAAIEALKTGKTGYQPTKGDYELREAIQNKLRRQNSIDTDISQIMVTPGAKFGIYLAFQALLQPGDSIMILEPSWVTFVPSASLTGANVIRVNLDDKRGFQPNIDLIEDEMDDSVKLIVLNSPCNPTGSVYDKEAIKEIARMARENGSFILSDELYEDLVFEGSHYSPGSEFENIITVNGFSKSFAMTGWRLGYVVAPEKIIDGMEKLYQHSATCVNSFSQWGACEALVSEKSQKALREMVKEYENRRSLIMSLINKSSLFSCERPQGAFYCFPKYDAEISSVELSKKLLEKKNVATVPGKAFGENGEGYLRLCYAASEEDIKKAFKRIEDFTRELN
ncbi:pyridoxal phosphate-dependent aminotransferase [Candidatus Bipolaricaulota bacterium]|nr:pyridoxal phosphate-dependent aminotransferase [Candidatus Bipolaricaulota bacterium]MBS3792106.1 pyridoxal phosphate-dependent aminotransferase [Candidatus Bipolaricaulota bacterium]